VKGLTPSFPAYPSGHSTFVAVATEVLNDIYGKTYAMTDKYHEGRPEFNEHSVASKVLMRWQKKMLIHAFLWVFIIEWITLKACDWVIKLVKPLIV
jgi:hypothetical protein